MLRVTSARQDAVARGYIGGRARSGWLQRFGPRHGPLQGEFAATQPLSPQSPQQAPQPPPSRVRGGWKQRGAASAEAAGEAPSPSQQLLQPQTMLQPSLAACVGEPAPRVLGRRRSVVGVVGGGAGSGGATPAAMQPPSSRAARPAAATHGARSARGARPACQRGRRARSDGGRTLRGCDHSSDILRRGPRRRRRRRCSRGCATKRRPCGGGRGA